MDENSTDPTLLDYLNFGSKTATGVLGALNQPKTATAKSPASNLALIGGIAAVVLGVVLLVVLGGKR